MCVCVHKLHVGQAARGRGCQYICVQVHVVARDLAVTPQALPSFPFPQPFTGLQPQGFGCLYLPRPGITALCHRVGSCPQINYVFFLKVNLVTWETKNRIYSAQMIIVWADLRRQTDKLKIIFEHRFRTWGGGSNNWAAAAQHLPCASGFWALNSGHQGCSASS